MVNITGSNVLANYDFKIKVFVMSHKKYIVTGIRI